MKPVLFVTNHAPPFRVGAFAALHEREDVVFALIGGDVRHGGGAGEEQDLPFPVIRPRQQRRRAARRAGATARWSRGSPGRVALLAAYARRPPGARAVRAVGDDVGAPADAPPRASYLPLRHLYRHADAIVTYGPHVSAYVRSKGAPQTVVEAPQSVDNAYWNGPADPNSARRVPGCVCRENGRGKGTSSAHSGLEFLGPVGTQRRAGSGRRRSDPSPGRRHRRGRCPKARARRPKYATSTRERRCGRTVGPHARLPRAVGPGRQRSLQPGSPRDRLRCRRRRRRRPRAPRAHRARRPRRGRARRSPPRCGGCTTSRRCGRGWAPPGARRSSAYTHDAWAAGVSSALAAVGREPLLAWKPMVRLLTLSGLILLLAAVPRRARASASRSCASARTAASPATTRRSSSATRASTSPPTSTSTPTAATCSRRPRWPAAAAVGRERVARRPARRAAWRPSNGAQPADRQRSGREPRR